MPVIRDTKKREEVRRKLNENLKTGEDVSTTIKSLRTMMAMDQVSFAKYCSVSLSALRRIEQKNGNYQVATLEKLLKAFGLKIAIVKA